MANEQQALLAARSPLASKHEAMAAASHKAISIEERPFLTQINLRGNCDDKSFMEGTQKALGLKLPTKPNSSAKKGDIAALWLGPDEWMIIAPPDEGARLIATLKVMLSHMHVAITDLSDNRTTLCVKGPKIWDVLSKGGILDFHPNSWAKGECAQSSFGRAQVNFWLTNAGRDPEFHLFVRNSFADYLATFLLDAMKEFAPE